tara:strand:+ start:409 stop:675 length:267 start_codon:yes stop_codon:yes gene_type:complete
MPKVKYEDHFKKPSHHRTNCRGVGKFGLPSNSWINAIVKSRQMSNPKNCHKGVGILSASSFGITASNWAVSPQSPPSSKSQCGTRWEM